MSFKVITGSGTGAKPSSSNEQSKPELRIIKPPPREPYPLARTTTTPDKEAGSCFYQFKFGQMETGAVVTIRAVFNDKQSGADVAITHMTTWPAEVCGEGYGSTALQTFLKALKEKGLQNIQAVQVQKPSQRFWIKNGFVALSNATNDFKYTQHTDPA